jgi:hypothetical protein
VIVDIVLSVGIISIAILASIYREQRNDLAAWVVHKHPEDLEELENK